MSEETTAGKPGTVDSTSPAPSFTELPNIEDPVELEKIAKETIKEIASEQDFEFMGIKFPWYFKDPRWVQLPR